MERRARTEREWAASIHRALGDARYVNIGIGIPKLALEYPDEEVPRFYHCENGLIGMARRARPEEADPMAIDAGSQPVVLAPGAAVVDHVASFAIIRGGHLDATVLGAMQVSVKGDLANWSRGKSSVDGVGGAMDLAISAPRVIVAMRHLDKRGNPKIVTECTLPLTAPRCVKVIVTDLATLEITQEGLVVQELAPGWTLDDLAAVTAGNLLAACEGAGTVR